MKSQRIASLDGLRGIAILQVLVWHFLASPASHSNGHLSRAFSFFAQFTWSGVDLFFVLSGFLIGGILVSAKGSDLYFSTFYIRRACRILPIYILILGCMAVWTFTHTDASAVIHRPMPWIVYATFTQNFWLAHRSWESWNVFLAVTWSLAVEEQFYLLLPAFIRFAPRRHLAKIVIAIIVATPILRSALFLTHHLPGTASYVMLYCRTDALMLGVLGALLVRDEQWMQRIRGHRWMVHSTLLLSTIPLLAMAWRHCGVGATAMSTLGFTFLASFYFLVLIEVVCFETGVVAAICRNRLLTWSGLLAYGLYLLHFPIFDIVTHLARSYHPVYPSAAYFLVVAATAAATFSLAALSWNYVESRFVQVGHSFSYKRAQTAARGSSFIVVASTLEAVGEQSSQSE